MKYLKRVLPYVGALALIALLLRQIDPGDVTTLLTSANVGWLLIGCGWYVLTNLLRACRYGVLLNMSGPLAPLRLLPEMFALSFLNNVLPSRAGELSFPYFMARRHGIAVGESASVLVASRIFDYLAVACLYVIFTAWEFSHLDARSAQIVGGVALLLLLSTTLLAAAPWLLNTLLHLLTWLLQRAGLSETAQRWVQDAGRQAVITFARIRNWRTYGLTFGWSLLIWLATFAWFGALLSAIGLPQRYPLVVVGSTFASLAKALPFITIGGFGAHEAGWTIGFTLTGMETATAISSGFAVNILTLLMSVLFGGVTLLFIGGSSRSASGQRNLEAPNVDAPPETPPAPAAALKQ
ncbi:MAG: flippase-like domain-containing protein [Caldilineaceae bacterium]|nr:flippase-like domain-containing protein [Caldilineaceae bacterium]